VELPFWLAALGCHGGMRTKLLRLAIPFVGLLLSVSLGGCLGWFTALLNTSGADLTGIACPSTSTCIAVGTTQAGGSLIRVTTDSGNTWDQVTNGVSGSGLAAISCPSAETCITVGGTSTVLETSDGGATWTALSPSDPNQDAFTSISCPTTEQCLAIQGGTVVETSNGGTTWQTGTWSPPQVEDETSASLSYISCLSMTDCVAAGQLTVSVFPPTTTVPPGFPPGTIAPEPVVGSLLATTTDGGTTWASQFFPSQGALTGVSCVGPSTCIAIGSSSPFASTDGGTAWEQGTGTEGEGVPSGAVTCSDALHCLAVGTPEGGQYSSPIMSTADGGMHWSGQPTQQDTADLMAVACTNTNDCFAVGTTGSGEVILRTLDGGYPSPMVTGVSPSSGALTGGMQVTVTGSGFQYGVSGVFFGSATASNVQVMSPTELTATAPPSPVVVPANSSGVPLDVTVQTQFGTSPLDPRDYFTYLPPATS